MSVDYFAFADKYKKVVRQVKLEVFGVSGYPPLVFLVGWGEKRREFYIIVIFFFRLDSPVLVSEHTTKMK